MLQNPRKTLGFKKNMVYKIPPGGGGGKPYPASGLYNLNNLGRGSPKYHLRQFYFQIGPVVFDKKIFYSFSFWLPW